MGNPTSDQTSASVEEIELVVGDERVPGRVNVPDEGGANGVVCLPGAGHGPYGGVFDRVAESAAERGQYFLRYESWHDQADIKEKTLRQLHAEIDAAIDHLQSLGCTDVSVIGKSFGGGIVLTYAPGLADRVVLWAPAVRVGDESNVEDVYTTPLGDTGGVRVGPGDFGSIDVPVRVLQGTDDEVMPIENTQRIVDGISNGELVEMDGRDHSFAGETFERIVERETLDFLTA